MIISSITLENFKSFRGEHELFNLDSVLSPNQNVILFGGLNGAGKTTLLEALFLCFYGRLATGHYPSKGARLENYYSYITNLLNNTIKRERTLDAEMSVEISLKNVLISGPIPRDVKIKRKWTFVEKAGVWSYEDEDIVILENDEPIEELDPDSYQDVILKLLPYNVSQFFFFDGEKIQDFAADADNEFAESLKDVLGISIYSTLVDDLKKVRSRILTEYNKNKDAKVKLQERRLELETLEQEIQEWEDEISNLNDEIGQLESEKEHIEQETYRVTLVSTFSRDNFENEKIEKEKEKEFLEKEFIETSKNYLPFMLANQLFDEIISQLDSEIELGQWRAIQDRIEPQIDAFIQSVFDDNPPEEVKLRPRQKRYYELKVDEAIRTFFLDEKNQKVDGIEPIHQLNEKDSKKVINFITSTINQGVVKTLAEKADRLKQVNIVLDKIGRTKARAGDNNEEIQKLLDRRSFIDMEIGQKWQKIQDVRGQIDSHYSKIETCKREITNWEYKAELSEKEKREIEYCEKMKAAISDFQQEFQTKRTSDLEEAILEMWNCLTHKSLLIHKVKVFPESNFEVKLYDKNNGEVDKTKLSAGEKEVYAISLLWALIKVSGKKFPIVIDTPFGRLDSVHRKNLVTEYFPRASHQVILLSQDEEIVGNYYKLLQPCIARELTITNDESTSYFSENYPFKEGKYATAS